MIGPATLDFLRDFTARHTASLDALYTILQVRVHAYPARTPC